MSSITGSGITRAASDPSYIQKAPCLENILGAVCLLRLLYRYQPSGTLQFFFFNLLPKSTAWCALSFFTYHVTLVLSSDFAFSTATTILYTFSFKQWNLAAVLTNKPPTIVKSTLRLSCKESNRQLGELSEY